MRISSASHLLVGFVGPAQTAAWADGLPRRRFGGAVPAPCRIVGAPRMPTPTVSLIIPALNEESGIAATIHRAPPDIHEIIVVDGGSKDRTAELAREAGAKVIIEPKRGYGLAYKRGFAAATGELIATADADGTYPIEMIPHVVDFLLKKDLNFVNCSRLPLADSKSMHRMNMLGNVGLSLVASALYLHPFRDICSGMWVFRRAVPRTSASRHRGLGVLERVQARGLLHGAEQVRGVRDSVRRTPRTRPTT